ncbi:MAG: GGDEF domain-containing phosphodiesterase [Eubacteriales bacterium]|nr:GGDEF domain-containing phosphodiesterase [Eubacteriales bacterium]
MVDMGRYNKLRLNPDRYNYDLATDLPLRRTFWRIADEKVLFDDKLYCMLAVDVENFHLINKWYGREVGDELLIKIGEVIKNIDKEFGTISGYMGGDNFCLVFENNDELIKVIKNRISKVVNGYRGHGITRAYFGAYKTSDKDITVGEMCDYAINALDMAKQRPDKDLCWYDERMAREQEEEARLMPEICNGMENDEFTFYLQPKCILQTGKIIGAEALVRWISPERGFISPGQFIPMLEKNGFISKLDVYIWDKVCQTIRRWIDEGRTVLPISINVSRTDIYSLDVVKVLKDMVNKYNIPTDYLEIEITESAYVENGSIIKDTEEAFKNAGFKILIDDFGSGYSSLNMLKDIDADVLKLDMKFLDLNAENNDKGVSIITAVLDMARQLDLPTIAEGIETDEQLKLLELLGCEYAQGFYYYRPMPISDYEKLIDDKSNVVDKLNIFRRRKNDKSYLKEITDYFWKIAEVDVDTGEYHFIRKVEEPEYVMKPRPATIGEYAARYIEHEIIHPDDAALYKEAINLNRIKKRLAEGKERGRYQIRYLIDGTYKWYVFEITKLRNYSDYNRRVLFSWKEADYQAGVREDTMDIIFSTFIKVVKADFIHDRYELIKSTDEDIIRDDGLSGSIDEYMDRYISEGIIHPEDVPAYKEFVDADKVLEHFRNSSEPLRLRFRRLLDGEYKWVEITVSKSKDYCDEIPAVIFYLREIRYIYEDTVVPETGGDEKDITEDIWHTSEYNFVINLSTDEVLRTTGISEWEREMGIGRNTFSSCIAYLTNGYICDEYKTVYKDFMDRQRLIDEFNQGHQFQTLDYRRMFKGKTVWMRIIMFLYKDNETGDIYAREIVMNINEAKKQEMDLWRKAAKKQ